MILYFVGYPIITSTVCVPGRWFTTLPLYRLAVYCDGLDAFAHTIGILHGNMIFCPAEPTLHVEAFPACRDTRIDFQTFIRRLDAEYELRDGIPHPGSRSGQPAVFCLHRGGRRPCRPPSGSIRKARCVDAGHCLFGVRRADLAVYSNGPPWPYGFCDDDPWVVVAEDTCVLLVAGGIGGDFSILQYIAGEGLEQYNTVLGVQPLSTLSSAFLRPSPFFQSDACHCTSPAAR